MEEVVPVVICPNLALIKLLSPSTVKEYCKVNFMDLFLKIQGYESKHHAKCFTDQSNFLKTEYHII